MVDEIKKDTGTSEILTGETQQEQETLKEKEALEEQETSEKVSLEQLQKELEEKTAQAEEHYNHMLRIQADFDNFRRRSRQEKEDILKFADEDLITELLPVLDNFERALAADGNDGEDFVAGVEMIYRQLKDILVSRGLEVIPTVGEEFDPHYHEAVMQVESEEYKENTITEEFRRGYILKEKVIRAAMVKVAK